MGDRVSISYKKDDSESTWLYSHWGGFEFAQEALEHARAIRDSNPGGRVSLPLDRLEPDTVLVDFIRAYTKDMDRVEFDLYLPASNEFGDDSDNGHFTINLETMKLER